MAAPGSRTAHPAEATRKCLRTDSPGTLVYEEARLTRFHGVCGAYENHASQNRQIDEVTPAAQSARMLIVTPEFRPWRGAFTPESSFLDTGRIRMRDCIKSDERTWVGVLPFAGVATIDLGEGVVANSELRCTASRLGGTVLYSPHQALPHFF